MRQALEKKKRFKVLQRDGFMCVYCGRFEPDQPLEVDHLVSVAHGGTNHFDNLVASCRDCNRSKRERSSTHPDIERMRKHFSSWFLFFFLVGDGRTVLATAEMVWGEEGGFYHMYWTFFACFAETCLHQPPKDVPEEYEGDRYAWYGDLATPIATALVKSGTARNSSFLASLFRSYHRTPNA